MRRIVPSPTRRRTTLRPSPFARVAGESVHAINNALGLLYGAEHLLDKAGAAASAEGGEARGCMEDAMRRLGSCADALHLLALHPTDLRAAVPTPCAALAEAAARAFEQSGLALRWARDLPARGTLQVDASLLGWLLSCVALVVRRASATQGAVVANAAENGTTLALEWRAPRPDSARRAAPDLGTLALADRRALLASAGLRVSLARRGGEIIVKLRVPYIPDVRPAARP